MTNDEKKTLLQQRYAELDDESLCALERHKLTEQARELFDAELARRGLDLAAYEARHGDSLYRSRTALRQRQWRGVGLKAILAGVMRQGKPSKVPGSRRRTSSSRCLFRARSSRESQMQKPGPQS